MLLYLLRAEFNISRCVVRTGFRKVQEFPLKDADVWFIRFGMDFGCNTLACGNRIGDVFVWRPHSQLSPPLLLGKLQDKACRTAVRQTAVSRNGKIILAACDGGTVWRWDARDSSTTTRTGEEGAEDDDSKACVWAKLNNNANSFKTGGGGNEEVECVEGGMVRDGRCWQANTRKVREQIAVA